MATYFNGKGQKVSPVSDEIRIITANCPVLNITSDTEYSQIQKEVESNGMCQFLNNGIEAFNLPIKFKTQGASSSAYPKKNLKLKFYKDDGSKQNIQFNDWYKTNKYVIKSNYREAGYSANQVTAKIIQNWLTSDYPNGCAGVIMSFPCVIYYNNEFIGTFSFNTDQNGDTYGFTKKLEKNLTQQAWRCDPSEAMYTVDGWKYKGSEDITDTTYVSLPVALINKANTQSLTKAELEAVFNKDSLINYIMMSQILLGLDNYWNNLTLVTWDKGSSWYFTFYDLDPYLGIAINTGDTSDMATPDTIYIKQSNFWNQIAKLYENEYPVYYAKFRDGGMNEDSITNVLYDYNFKFGIQNIERNFSKWYGEGQEKDVLGWNVTQLKFKQMIEKTRNKFIARFNYLDSKYGYGVSTHEE